MIILVGDMEGITVFSSWTCPLHILVLLQKSHRLSILFKDLTVNDPLYYPYLFYHEFPARAVFPFNFVSLIFIILSHHTRKCCRKSTLTT